MSIGEWLNTWWFAHTLPPCFPYHISDKKIRRLRTNIDKLCGKTTRREPQITDEYMKKFSVSLVIRELHIKIRKH